MNEAVVTLVEIIIATNDRLRAALAEIERLKKASVETDASERPGPRAVS